MASTFSIQCMAAGGRPFTIMGYLATDAAAGVYMNLDMNKPAVATSPDNVIMPRAVVITDIIGSVGGVQIVSGVLELVAGGHGTGNFIEVAGRAPANAGRAPMHVPIARGTQLMVAVVTSINDA